MRGNSHAPRCLVFSYNVEPSPFIINGGGPQRVYSVPHGTQMQGIMTLESGGLDERPTYPVTKP